MFGNLFSSKSSTKPETPVVSRKGDGEEVDVIALAVKTLGIFCGKRIDYALQVILLVKRKFLNCCVFISEYFKKMVGKHHANAESIPNNACKQGTDS